MDFLTPDWMQLLAEVGEYQFYLVSFGGFTAVVIPVMRKQSGFLVALPTSFLEPTV